MKKLYLILLMLLILFIPTTQAVAVYQLDQPISELNGYTLREVFENRNMAMPDLTGKTEISAGVYRIYNDNGLTLDYNTNNGHWVLNGTATTNGWRVFYLFPTNTYTQTATLKHISGSATKSDYWIGLTSGGNYTGALIAGDRLTDTYTFNITNLTIDIRSLIILGDVFNNLTFTIQLEKGSTATPYQVPTNGPYSDIDVSDFNLTSEQIQKYYNLYLEAVRFEIENEEAFKDPGDYQNIFRSILNGVKGLIESMGEVWSWLNAPIVSGDITDYAFEIDWSWDLIGVLRQIMNGLAGFLLTAMLGFSTILFSLLGISVEISILSLLFSNLVFVILGWIMIKSFII